MPSEQHRPSLGNHRSTTSIQSASPSTPPHHSSAKKVKHAVGGGRGHGRVPSNKGLHKMVKGHGEGSHMDLKKMVKGGGGSTTNLKKNISATNLNKESSQTTLKRNRSAAEIHKRPRSAHGHGQSHGNGHGQDKAHAAVHFEIGDQEEWEEASSKSASPALSRSASRSHQSSAKASASNSQHNSRPQSPVQSPLKQLTSAGDGENGKHAVDGRMIAERLLNRTPSHNTTKMSLATATPVGHSPDEMMSKSQGEATLNGTPRSKDGAISSRFVGGAETPGEYSAYLNDRVSSNELPQGDAVKRAQSMGNLTRQDSIRDDTEEEEESALAPHSRKSSTHTFIPPSQSRTQQKLWLQRASSNIEPAQMTPGLPINSLQGIHGGLGGSSLVGAGYDGKDPRIKIQLERTGLEYLVVRRHQDPVGKALKRLEQLPNAGKSRRIPNGLGSRKGDVRSMKESRGNTPVVRSSFEGRSQPGSDGLDEREDDGGVGALLRTLWEKSRDFSASTD